MSDALKLGLVPRNVVALVDPVKYQTVEFTIWSADEIVRFLTLAQRADYYAFWYTALTTGMRPGELIALHWEDVGGDTLHVRRTISVVANKPVLKAYTKTKHGKRVLALPDDTSGILAELREGAEGPLVFPSRRGSFLSHRNLRRALTTYAEKAGVSTI